MRTLTPAAIGSHWQLETREVGLGQALSREDAGTTRLRVSDQTDGDRVDLTRDNVTEAWLSPDGTAVVRSHRSPPALLVGADGARLLPTQPDSQESAVMQPGDLLVLCSSAVLDAEPTGLGAVLAWSPRRLAHRDPADVLARVLDGVGHGAAAVARRTGTAPTTEEDR